MKERAYCKTCKQNVRPILTTTGTFPFTVVYHCDTCVGNIDTKDIRVDSFSFEECMEIAKYLEDGKPHPDYPDVANKVGTLHKCKKCKTMLGIKNYCNADFITSQMTCCEGLSCDKDDGLLVEKKSDADDLPTLRAQKILEIVNNIFEKTPPQSDSIFEFDRILWFITEIQLPGNSIIDALFLAEDEYRLVMDLFMLKCTEIGITRLRD